jgi:phosphocarrier protein FPr
VATQLSEIIACHDAQVQLRWQESIVDCSSILDVLGLGLGRGSQVRLTAQGPDADKVLAALQAAFSRQDDP